MLGAICGDVLGSLYEFEEVKYDNPDAIVLMRKGEHPTDDSAMTLAVADWVLHDITEGVNDAELITRLAEKFVVYAFDVFGNKSHLGFGGRFKQWLNRGCLLHEFTPYNSFGNGSGMRVSPVGWAFDTLEETLRYAKLSADVTHNHPEGEKGAMCIAAAIFLARTGKTKQEIKDYLYEIFQYEMLLQDVKSLRATCRWSEICQDTVPMSVVAFLESEDYASALRLAYSYGSDSDTIGAMTGAIAEAFYGGVPADLAAHCLGTLPEAAQALCREFKETLQ